MLKKWLLSITWKTPKDHYGLLLAWYLVALFVAGLWIVLCSGCASDLKCPGKTALNIEAEYSAKILEACSDAESLKDCPAYDRLDAERKAKETQEGCR